MARHLPVLAAIGAALIVASCGTAPSPAVPSPTGPASQAASATSSASATTPCTADELNLATVFVWAGGTAYRVALDGRLDSVSAPAAVAGDPWPAPGSSRAPAARRVTPAGAPKQIANRTALPWCGSALLSQPASVSRCFVDAVLSGRPAEMRNAGDATEGGEVSFIYRFTGTGAIIEYDNDGPAWTSSRGALIVNPDGGFSFEAWQRCSWRATEARIAQRSAETGGSGRT